ncbi:hypothetical protein [Bacillus sp. FJAT-50079]|uniref:hypothetical protein n=1 Tax=Bacillus sp. FJAT-50079 TaxID=2833577 RepID=UPI001BC93323|nr:hypothetical protein [Bacillus sp. FJAT-50079]MBS4209141.1 hypothetical protein [Bacillus sp. FJAT-50079]
MYEIVKSSRQQKKFAHTWEYFCEKYGWHNDPYAKNGVRYNLLSSNNRKRVIGTVEFIPYDPNNPHSTVEGRMRFSEFEGVKLHQQRVWEIDKLCLHQDYQRRGYFENFMPVFYDHVQSHKPKYYIGLMEKRFFRMLRISFRLGIEQKGAEFVGPSTTLIPVLFDVEKMMENEEMVRRLFKAQFTEHEDRMSIFKKLVLTKVRRIFSH